MKRLMIVFALFISANLLQAQCTFQLSGIVTSDNGSPVEGATVIMNADFPEFPISTMTNENGIYSFSFEASLDFGFELTVEDETNWMDGVSTLDLVMIQRHILGIQSLTNEGFIFAADANDDGNVTAMDMLLLRSLILGWITELPSANIISIPQFEVDNNEIELQSVDCVVTNSSGPFDFKIYKRGDVNGTWSKNW